MSSCDSLASSTSSRAGRRSSDFVCLFLGLVLAIFAHPEMKLQTELVSDVEASES